MSIERAKAQTASNAKDRFVLRFHDEEQRAHLKARAALNHRSLNAEILFLIERGQAVIDGPKSVG